MILWSQIINKEFDFKRNQKKIEALKNITKQEVDNMFVDIFFRKPKRINLKLHSHAVLEDNKLIAKRQENIEKNTKFYKDMERIFEVNYNYQEIDLKEPEKFQQDLQTLPRRRE